MSNKHTLKEIAGEVLSGSPVSAGRTKISTEELISRFPNGVHFTSVDLFAGQNGTYAVFTLLEDDNVYYSSGTLLTQIIHNYLDRNGGDLDALNAEMKAEPFGVRLFIGKNKKGQALTKVELI